MARKDVEGFEREQRRRRRLDARGVRTGHPRARPGFQAPERRDAAADLVYLAQHSELHVTDLCNRLGQSQPAVSHHLALLRVSGLIESRREGKHNFYSVRTDHFGELLVNLFSATGEMPKKVRFHDFMLTYSGSGQ